MKTKTCSEVIAYASLMKDEQLSYLFRHNFKNYYLSFADEQDEYLGELLSDCDPELVSGDIGDDVDSFVNEMADEMLGCKLIERIKNYENIDFFDISCGNCGYEICQCYKNYNYIIDYDGRVLNGKGGDEIDIWLSEED